MRTAGLGVAVCGLVVGCNFEVGGLSQANHVLSPDLGVGDLAAPPPPSSLADLASLPDLELPPACTRVSETFDVDPSPRWALAGDASFDASAHVLQLTTTNIDVAGSAFFATAIFTPAFDVRFDFRIGDGTGADGMAFVFAKADSAAKLGPYGNGQLNSGWGLGYLNMDGFALELDTFKNSGNSDPDNNHVALMLASTGTHLLTASPPAPPLHASPSRSAHMRWTASHILVEIDGVKVLDEDLPPSIVFTPDQYWFGFTGAGGGFTDRHTVRDFNLVVGPAGVCF
jgi:hypothetical protein